MKLKTLAEVMAELPEDERRKIEARAQELIAEEEARRARRRENGVELDVYDDIEDAELLARSAD